MTRMLHGSALRRISVAASTLLGTPLCRSLRWHVATGLSKRHLVIAVLVCMNLTANARETSSPESHRPFNLGPLTVQDFQKSPPEVSHGKAYTQTRVMFTYEYGLQKSGNNVYEASLTKLQTYSVFLPRESWWNHPSSAWLLDHEQGHFDIAEITSRRVQLTFNRLFKSRKTVTAKGRTAALAKKALVEKLNEVMVVANKQALQENEEYDRRTAHGMKRREQLEHRRIQKLTLQRLAAELKNKRRDSGRPDSQDQDEL